MAKQLSFPYVGLPIRNPATKILLGTLYRPLVPIQLEFNGSTSLLFEALVDSGADKCLFPADIGTAIGIDFSKIKPNKARGIGNHEVVTYTSPITLKIKDKAFETKADFSREIDYPLLGRQGFFNLFAALTFDEIKKKVIIQL